MKKIFFSLLFLSTLVRADVSTLFVKNFNFDYVNPHGRGLAESFGLGTPNGSALDVTIDKLERNFKLSVSGTEPAEYEFKNAPDLLVNAEGIVLNSFNLTLADKLNVTLNSGRYESTKDSIKIDGLMIDANRDTAELETLDQILQGSTQRLSFKMSKFFSADSKHFFEELLKGPAKGADIGITSFDLKINSRKFDLSADLRAQVSGKVKASGQMSYDSARGQITLKISEVKFGFLNITSKVFDELRKSESSRLKVKEPYVYYLVR